ncbi:ProQ/FINO family protein [Rhodoblastus acidophilus]|uniref:ProQ/FINO family protein n=1 Tax=Rhodoblastus acidophilus TaxID=1074 RepID=A0A212SBT9_RHOAC|nr:ProQ/FinO family protein [Rhodoblastus acidophilus]PPQ35402.1 hypothetical protein CKO16_20585 [Rhodoblastus acidophilus]RAI17027.1 hypothetical protein CH337_18200 [Rhodoblastus acidophilus]SNB82995.1 ProQ/FINO family protein [Rhodoblastus acidophilus]
MNKTAKARCNAARDLLHAKWPTAFAGRGCSKKPLAIGITKQIMTELPEIGFHRLTAALSDYCSGPTYLRNVIEGAPRVGLDGRPCGVVSPDEASYAAQRLADWKTHRDAKSVERAAQ